MKNNLKLWVFQSKRTLTSPEIQDISEKINAFVQSWDAHNHALKANFSIEENRFIVITVDENQTVASGCSIDKLNGLMRQIDSQYQLDLMNRLWVSYQPKEGKINTLLLSDFKKNIKEEKIPEDSWVYNLSVSTVTEYKEKFKLPLKDSWAASFLSK